MFSGCHVFWWCIRFCCVCENVHYNAGLELAHTATHVKAVCVNIDRLCSACWDLYDSLIILLHSKANSQKYRHNNVQRHEETNARCISKMESICYGLLMIACVPLLCFCQMLCGFFVVFIARLL